MPRPDPINDGDKVALLFGCIIGYVLFACFIALYQMESLGHVEGEDFFLRLLTPLTIQAGHLTDAVCYGLVALSCIGAYQIRKRLWP